MFNYGNLICILQVKSILFACAYLVSFYRLIVYIVSCDESWAEVIWTCKIFDMVYRPSFLVRHWLRRNENSTMSTGPGGPPSE